MVIDTNPLIEDTKSQLDAKEFGNLEVPDENELVMNEI